MLQRPLNPAIRLLDCPPCLDRHGKDDDCDLCDETNKVWTSSEEFSGVGSQGFYSEGGSPCSDGDPLTFSGDA